MNNKHITELEVLAFLDGKLDGVSQFFYHIDKCHKCFNMYARLSAPAGGIDKSKIECGELIRALERGYVSWDKVIQLDSVISGSVQGRKSNRDITLFESQGIALEDLAVSEFVYKRAIQNNIGLQI